MPNQFGKTVDKTFLSIDHAEERGFLHRDYIAHCFRWTHVVKFLNKAGRYKTAHILDVGCGREFPLLKTLYTSRMIPQSYTGIDVGPINPIPDAIQKKIQTRVYPQSNILEITTVFGYTEIIMFEVLEHMEKEMGIRVLAHLREFMTPKTIFFLSTPCYDGVHKAANHVHEWTYKELEVELIEQGFYIENVWGTFASIKDYIGEMNSYERDLFDRLSSYYDTNVLSTIFAPLFPEQSRNCLWMLRRND